MDTAVRDEKLHHPGHCLVSWSAVIAGALVAFSLSALLNLLNAGLGLVAFPESFQGLTVGVGGYIWLIICGIVVMFIAGWVAGKIARHLGGCHGLLHGFLAWSLALLLTVIVAAHFAQAGAAALTKDSDRADVSHVLERADGRTEEAVGAAGTATLGLFFIFLLGAAAATVGGYVGAKGDKGHGMSEHHHTHTTTRY